MHRVLVFLVAITAAASPSDTWGQGAADTLPERVIDNAYVAFNRHDAAAFLANFAETWWYSLLEDTAAAPHRNVRAEELEAYRKLDAFRNRPTIRLVRRLVAGPYVIDLQSRGHDSVLRLDIFEVRNGKIVREWESGHLPSQP
jgi:hypothetical protein